MEQSSEQFGTYGVQITKGFFPSFFPLIPPPLFFPPFYLSQQYVCMFQSVLYMQECLED